MLRICSKCMIALAQSLAFLRLHFIDPSTLFFSRQDNFLYREEKGPRHQEKFLYSRAMQHLIEARQRLAGMKESVQQREAIIYERVRGRPDALEPVFRDLLRPADVLINPENPRPWDIDVHNKQFYERVVRRGLAGVADGYVLAEWDTQQLDELAFRVYDSGIDQRLTGDRLLKLRLAGHHLRSRFDRDKSFEVGKKHYDLPPLLWDKMLGDGWVYSGGYWKEATTLEEAQKAKMERLAQKLALEPGMRVLDVGGGAGALAAYLAREYGVSVVNIGISEEQIAEANRICAGLAVQNRLQDYKTLADEPYDRIVSVGMLEHVGEDPKEYKNFMAIMAKHLKPHGLLVLQTIATQDKTETTSSEWIAEHIFPHSRIPRIIEITEAVGNDLILEHAENLGAHYDKTLMAWHQNFTNAWGELQHLFEPNPEEFRRKWELYLLGSAGKFRARKLQLLQLVFSKEGLPGGYDFLG